MESLEAYFRRDRRSEAVALEDETRRSYDAHWLLTTSWKAGNFLRHSGVREGTTVGVVGDGPFALVAFFGTALLGGETRFEPPREGDYRAVVAPVGMISEYTLPTGSQRIGYGSKPSDPAIHHFDAGLWSENPSFPPVSLEPTTPLLTDGERSATHAQALEAASAVVERTGIDNSSRVAVRGPFTDLRTVIGGVIAPLSVGATIVRSGAETETVDVSVGGADVGEHTISSDTMTISPETITW